MKVTPHWQEQDWTVQHAKCEGNAATVYTGSDGHQVCKRCFDLGSEQRFLSRISSFLLDLDAAQLLHCRLFASDTVDAKMAELREKAIYRRRSKTAYEKVFEKDDAKLHKEAIAFFFLFWSV